jgi:tRNA-specific 2-thiouridylase
MSGGVDSGVAAHLLAGAGYEVVGITLHLRDEADGRGSGAEVESARQAVETVGGTHHLIDARQEFGDLVIREFAAEYAAGRTPNPCVRCNERLKWAILTRQARLHEADCVATGHYARVSTGGDRPVLRTGIDPARDQSYVLWRIGSRALASTLLPLGELTKAEVRSEARRLGLAAAGRDESQDICFIPRGDYGSFLEGLVDETEDPELGAALSRALEPGPIVDGSGEVLGTHRGVARYTIGQRHGLRVAAGHPLYVTAIDPSDRTIVVGPEADLERNELRAASACWLSIEPPSEPFPALVRVRYRGPLIPARVTPSSGEAFTLSFDSPQRAAAPGQSAVLYDGEIVLGGGIIIP